MMRRKIVASLGLVGILLLAWFFWPWGYRIKRLMPVAQGQALLVSRATKSSLHRRIAPNHQQTGLALVSRDGQTLWHRLMDDGYWYLPSDARYAADTERLYLQARQDGRSVIQALSRESGETLWEHALAARFLTSWRVSVHVAGPRLYVLYSREDEPGGKVHSYTLTGLSTQDGAQLWQHTLKVQGSPQLRLLSDQLLMVYFTGQNLFFDGETGQKLPEMRPPAPFAVRGPMGWVGCAGEAQQWTLWRAEGLQLEHAPLGQPPARCSSVSRLSEYKGRLIYYGRLDGIEHRQLIAFQPETQERPWHLDLGTPGAEPFLDLELAYWRQPFVRWMPLPISELSAGGDWRYKLLVADLEQGEVVRRYSADTSVGFKLLLGTERSYLLRSRSFDTELVPIDPQSGAIGPALVFHGVGVSGQWIPAHTYTQDLWWFFEATGERRSFKELRWGVFDLKRGEPAHLNGGYALEQSDQLPDWLKEIPGGL